MKHDFHFVLTRELKDNVIQFANNKNMKLSDAIVFVLNIMKPVLEKHFLIDLNCKDGGYFCFGAEVDMHVYFEKSDYKYLKQVQSNLYCYSIALVLRWILTEFFRGIRKYGFERFCEVVCRFGDFYLGINEDSDIKNNFIEINKRHLYASCQQINKIYHIFDNEYNLISTKFT